MHVRLSKYIKQTAQTDVNACFCRYCQRLSHVVNIMCILFSCLLLVSCSSRNAPAPVSDLYGHSPLNKRVKNSISASEYTVKSGETLYSIAWRANSDVRQLVKLNKLSPPYHIYPGQKLFLVAQTSTKSSKARPNKYSSKNQTKSSNLTSKKSVNKGVASSKKQAYGENVTKKEIVHNRLPNNSQLTEFSTKINRWQWPVKGKVIEGFSSELHGNKGINIVGRRSTKIRASADGKVVYAGSALRGYGKLIIIKHNDDYLSAYAHNDAILVKDKQHVKIGDVIATMGDSGAQRVMLHFEVRFRGKSVNPLKYLPRK